MSVDSPSDSKNLNSCKVTSKYFGSEGVMDESLSDFQEKKNLACAKNSQKVQKPGTSKPKPKKNIKKIRGQKDIRTVLKKKNELIAYSNEFEKICIQSGINVDSEQLQLAIALSKSLQQTETKLEEPSKPLTTQERSGKIRTTLQEYGFVVPEVKITASKSRKQKKYRKNYKLLQTTEAEKQQIISDKYSQVLFYNLDNYKYRSDCSDNTNRKTAQLYHIGTNISYEELKDNNFLYVENLLHKSPSFVGCLFKSWAEIPGRPVSPTLKPSCIKFEKIVCTQDELDIVLSGLVKTAQDIVKTKYSFEESVVTINKSENSCTKESKMDTDCIEIIEQKEVETNQLVMASKNKPSQVIDVENSNLLMVTQKVRSYSPDIFDEEVSEILYSSSTDVESQELPRVEKTKQCTEIMTECSQTSFLNPLSQGNQSIKRKSNDFMDITECVVGSSQAIRDNVIIEENIDLTQNSDEDNVSIIGGTTKIQDIQRMDLTQSSDSKEELPEVQISGNKSLDETIILNEDAYTGHLNTEKDYLGFKKREEKACDKDINNTRASFPDPQPISNFSPQDRASITIDSEDELENHTNIQNYLEDRAISPIKNTVDQDDHDVEICGESENKSTEAINIGQKYFKSTEYSEDCVIKSKTESFFEEFVHRHSESSGKESTNNILSVDEASADSIADENNSKNKNDGIDLTQDTDTSEEVTEPIKKLDSPKISFDSSNLGKIGDVSVDYDELFDDLVRSHDLQLKNISLRSRTTDFNSGSNIEKASNSDLVSNSSQNSEAFEISDMELDYSINKSRLMDNPKDNLDFDGISVVDNLPDLPSFRPSTNNFENRSLNMSESYLPMLEIKGDIENKNQEISKSNSTSPTACNPSRETIAKTPKNGEYIIKTDAVTPILDYDKMSTPERNAELDKYGLKPFKRKRAIQLLTHLYNQTHPIVESLEIDPCSSSPSKRFKPSTNPHISPTKRKSPKKIFEICKPQKKISKSLKLNENIEDQREDELEATDKDNDIYVVTDEVLEIRDIECCEEDWVFQKREKAKLHYCRVPLHIAFHNYVSSRQKLREAILRYEPVNIDDIHKGLVGNGFRYDPKDLLKFMDKKCITVKTADNSGRNKKHY